MIIEALLLGLSTGTYCTMYCGPVLLPFLFGADKITHKRNAALTGTFLLGRFVMYCILSLVFGSLGLLVGEFFNPLIAKKLSLWAYIITGLVLLFNSLGVRFPWGEEKYHGCKAVKLRHIGNDFVTAALSGLGVGLHICPPLWAAMFRSVTGGNGFAGLFFFVIFYAGTLPYFIPLFGIPFLKKAQKVLKPLARISQLLISIYFILFAGFIPLVFGA